MNSQRGISTKPLAAALAIALGATGMGADASAPSSSAFSAQMQAFKIAVTQIKQDYANHPANPTLFPNSYPHKLTRPVVHRPAAPLSATLSVTNCVDDASSGTTAGTLRYAVLNAAAGDTIDVSACANSTITLTQGALPVTVSGLTITAGAVANNVSIDGGGTDRVFFDTATGSGTLGLKYLTVKNGAAPLETSGSKVPAAIGGCIFAPSEGVALYQSTVTGCRAVSPTGIAEGGGIAAYGLFMYRSTISANTVTAGSGNSGKYYALGGGAVVPYMSVIIYSTIEANTVQSNGGTLADAGGLLAFGPVVYGSTIVNNHVHMSAGTGTGHPYLGVAGGLAAKYGARIKGSTISGNTADCTSKSKTLNAICIGGGVVDGTFPNAKPAPLSIAYSTVSGNSAGFLGGGVMSKYGVSLAQSTITGNSAPAGAGVLEKYTSAGVTAYNSTIAGNSAEYYGGGIYLYANGSGGKGAAPVTLASSIVGKNTAAGAPGDIYLKSAYSLTITGSNDLVMAASSNVTLPAGTLGADPQLGPLAKNGGPTQTMGLYAGSPALDVGSNPKNYSNDQRGSGFLRTTAGLTDIGAFQGTVAAPLPPAPTLSAWSLALLAGLLGLFGWRHRRFE